MTNSLFPCAWNSVLQALLPYLLSTRIIPESGGSAPMVSKSNELYVGSECVRTPVLTYFAPPRDHTLRLMPYASAGLVKRACHLLQFTLQVYISTRTILMSSSILVFQMVSVNTTQRRVEHSFVYIVCVSV